jgi:phytanoyl-CoA hydroxylase
MPEKWFSKFGGLWTDRVDAPQELKRRLAAGEVTPEDAERLTQWMEKGYVVLPGAVSTSVCDDVRQVIEQAWSLGDERLRVFPPGSHEPIEISPDLPTDRLRIIDIYAFVESARMALFSPPITHFLELVFERPPVLFQSLSFERGSQQGMHQDTAYVVTSSPLELAACWIALQDVTEGSGELMYYEGSHRLPEYHFSGEYKHYKPERDGPEQHDEWSALLNTNAELLGMARRTFLPKKGDALIWAADLAHGGSPVTDPDATRKSLVGHYCPVDVEPNYFGYRPDRKGMKPYATGFYASEYFDLSEIAETEPAPPQRLPSRKSSLLEKIAGRLPVRR